jgi:peptidoglycan/xylan/chitin deacetylase (PgdA/CDA1 family)
MGIIKSTLYRMSNKHLYNLFKNQTVFPYYHLVSDKKAPHIDYLYQFQSVDQFKKDINYFLTHYKQLAPDDFIKLTLNKEKLPNNSFLMSFDDGLQEIYSVVFPILKEYGMNAIFFINPAFVDNKKSFYRHDIGIIISNLKSNEYESSLMNKICNILSINFISNDDVIYHLKKIKYSERNKVSEILTILNINVQNYLNENKPYVTKEQIQEMIDEGFYFGSHSYSHPPFDNLTFLQQKDEIISSVEWIKNNFGIKYALFAFPFSDKGINLKLIKEVFSYDENLILFGNSGIKKDVDHRIIPRILLENPNKIAEKVVISENLYKYYNQLIGKYKIKRK